MHKNVGVYENGKPRERRVLLLLQQQIADVEKHAIQAPTFAGACGTNDANTKR
jgi:hypothetical protein